MNTSFISNLRFAIEGIKSFFTTEKNGQTQGIIAMITIMAGLLFRLTRIEWACILFCIAMVIAMEMMNSAIEKTCNYMTREISPQIKVIKDISAGAVLICAIVSAIIGMLIFIPYILKLLPVS